MGKKIAAIVVGIVGIVAVVVGIIANRQDCD